jgi:peroxiredoxin
MTLKVGDSLPDVTLSIMGENGPEAVSTASLLGTGRVVLFGVPGAFTPTCSARHLPGFIEHADALRARGIETLVCLSVNDVFVMDAWGTHTGADEIVMLADGNGEFAKALGLDVDASAFGMGLRSSRFALVAEDGVVSQLFVEAPGEFRVSSAEHLLANL